MQLRLNGQAPANVPPQNMFNLDASTRPLTSPSDSIENSPLRLFANQSQLQQLKPTFSPSVQNALLSQLQALKATVDLPQAAQSFVEMLQKLNYAKVGADNSNGPTT